MFPLHHCTTKRVYIITKACVLKLGYNKFVKIIEAIPGQGIIQAKTDRPEIEILTQHFAQHDRLLKLVPGFKADAIFPYSFGIFAGAAISGAISRDTAFELAQTRADIVRSAEDKKPVEERSAMGVVLASRDTISLLLDRFPRLDWTNDNGPGAHVLGGPIKDLRLLAEEAGKRFRGFLTAEGIYHSAGRENEAAEFRDKLASIKMKDPEIPLISSTGEIRQITSAPQIKEEMAGSMVRKIRLEEVVRYWSQKGYDAVIDISQGATLQQLITRFNTGFKFGSLEDEVTKLRDFFANLKTQISSL